MANTPLKKCPQCGALAYMNASQCQNCGRVFQTTNPNNPNQTTVIAPQGGQSGTWNPQQQYAYHGMKRQINWVAWSIIIGALIVISPIVLAGLSCAAGSAQERAARSQRPTVAHFRALVRPYCNSEAVVKEFGYPDQVSTMDQYEYWTFHLRDGNGRLTRHYGVITSVSTN